MHGLGLDQIYLTTGLNTIPHAILSLYTVILFLLNKKVEIVKHIHPSLLAVVPLYTVFIRI